MCHVQYTCSSWSYIWAAVKLNIRSVKFPCFSWTQNNFLLPRSKIKISKVQRSSKIKDQRSSKIKSSKINDHSRSKVQKSSKVIKDHHQRHLLVGSGRPVVQSLTEELPSWQTSAKCNSSDLCFPHLVILLWGNMFIEKYFVEQPDFSQTLKKECAIRRAEIGFLSICIWQEEFIGSREAIYIKKT